MDHVGGGTAELVEQRRQFQRAEGLGERGEPGQVGETDTAHHRRRVLVGHQFQIAAGVLQMLPVHRVDQGAESGHEPRGVAVGAGGDQFVVGLLDLDTGVGVPDHGCHRLGQPCHHRTDHPQQSGGGIVADRRAHIGPQRETVHIGLAECHLIGPGDGETERGPGPLHIRQRQAQRLGGGVQTVHRRTRQLQHITGQPEQATATLGRDHLLGGEAQARQILDQRGTAVRIGDPGGLQRVEIHHRASVTPGMLALG